MLGLIKNLILETLFPIYCVSCQKEKFWICEECLRKINLPEEQVCPYCEKSHSARGKICPACKNRFLKKNFPLENLTVSAKYKGEISKLIHLFKYNFVEDLSVPLGRIMVKSFLTQNLALPDLLVPTPLHPRRLRWRGFNQAEKLAAYLGENVSPGFSLAVIPDLIIKKKNTQAQMKIGSYKERQENLKNVFAINPKYPKEIFTNKRILLVDDVCTTGATLFECARVLKSAGAGKVSALVLARQEME